MSGYGLVTTSLAGREQPAHAEASHVAERHWADRFVRAGIAGPLIGLQADLATVCAQSTFDRPPAGGRDRGADGLDQRPARLNDLAMRRVRKSQHRVGPLLIELLQQLGHPVWDLLA